MDSKQLPESCDPLGSTRVDAVVAKAVGANLQGLLCPGEVVEEYEVGRRIGEGGMGVVYEAFDRRLGHRRVAIKVIQPAMLGDPALVERFMAEARLAASERLKHPRFVEIYCVGKLPGGQPFLVMEFLEGETLHQAQKKGRLSEEEQLSWFEQLLEGMEHAHRQGIVHRDLKPDNVFLQKRNGSEHLKILDLGLAGLCHRPETPSQERAQLPVALAERVGNRRYMAPETWLCTEEPKPSTDVFALGVMLYEALANRHPFWVNEEVDWATRNLEMAPLPVGVPEPLKQLIKKALSTDPSDRFRNAGEMLVTFQAALSEKRLEREFPKTEGQLSGTVGRNQIHSTVPPLAPGSPLLDLEIEAGTQAKSLGGWLKKFKLSFRLHLTLGILLATVFTGGTILLIWLSSHRGMPELAWLEPRNELLVRGGATDKIWVHGSMPQKRLAAFWVGVSQGMSEIACHEGSRQAAPLCDRAEKIQSTLLTTSEPHQLREEFIRMAAGQLSELEPWFWFGRHVALHAYGGIPDHSGQPWIAVTAGALTCAERANIEPTRCTDPPSCKALMRTAAACFSSELPASPSAGCSAMQR